MIHAASPAQHSSESWNQIPKMNSHGVAVGGIVHANREKLDELASSKKRISKRVTLSAISNLFKQSIVIVARYFPSWASVSLAKVRH
jgi:hypothetical protein